MNKNYTKPVIVMNNDVTEGVYLASGADASCYTIDATIVNQTPTEGRKNYVISINATHAADHTREAQTLSVSFNQPVHFISCGVGSLAGGDNTNNLILSMQYHQNPTDHIGFSDLTVESTDGLTITGAKITD